MGNFVANNPIVQNIVIFCLKSKISLEHPVLRKIVNRFFQVPFLGYFPMQIAENQENRLIFGGS